jgi:hypothetical protein
MFVTESTLLFVLTVLLLVSIWTFVPLIFKYANYWWKVRSSHLIHPVKEVLDKFIPRFKNRLNWVFKLFSGKAQHQALLMLRYLDGKLARYRNGAAHNGGRRESLFETAARLYKQVCGTIKPLFAWMLHFFISKQCFQAGIAALIEAPLRIGPDQCYFVRIRLSGRDRPATPEDGQAVGLNALTKGKLVHIEIRATLFEQSVYAAYQASIPMPASGYEAIITMPMKSPFSRPSGQYERVSISFMDEQGHPFYEKPFVIELFVSRHVRPGREGYNALAVPHLM